MTKKIKDLTWEDKEKICNKHQKSHLSCLCCPLVILDERHKYICIMAYVELKKVGAEKLIEREVEVDG